MTAWILPVAGAAFWAGLLARSLLGDGMPVWTWLLSGLVALASSLVLVPAEREAPDPLGQAGLVKPDEEPGAVAAVTVGRRRASRGSPVAPVLATLGVFVLAVGWGGVHANKVAGSLLARLATERVTVYGALRTDPSAQISGWSAVIDAGQVEWQARPQRFMNRCGSREGTGLRPQSEATGSCWKAGSWFRRIPSSPMPWPAGPSQRRSS